MFHLQSDNIYLSSALSYYCQHKGIHLNLEQNEPFFAHLVIRQHQNVFEITCNSQTLKLTTPQHIQIYFDNIMSLLKNVQINFGELIYSPILQVLELKNKNLKLKNIHNIILSNLLLYLGKGIEKPTLYKKIWPNDKSYHINKLDTHLTNLKNELKESLNFDLIFSSSGGNLKLRIN